MLTRETSNAAIVLFLTLFLTLVLAPPALSQERAASAFVPLPSFADLAQAVAPAVVNVSTETTLRGSQGADELFGDKDLEQFFERFFGDGPQKGLKRKSLGSGFIIDPSGLILTNYHVVEKADEVTVRMSDEKEFKAKIIGRDPKSDLALIQITGNISNLASLKLGNSDAMRVGDWVLAIGNPFGLSQTVTHGIISATHRVIGLGPYDNFLQSDAPVNPGNSGGPLVNLRGEVVGVTTAIVAQGQSLGFAIPSNMARNVVDQLRARGRVIRGYIGVSVQEVTPKIAQGLGLGKARGALVSNVVEGGPAAKAGIQSGDIIVSFAGQTIKTRSDLAPLVANTPIGRTVPVTVFRKGKNVSLQVQVAESKEEKTSEEAAGEPETKGRLGLAVGDITPELRKKFDVADKTGVIVLEVREGTPASEAGIQPGDIIKEVNKRPIETAGQFKKAIEAAADQGNSILLLIKRDQTTFFLTVDVSG